jgi:long-subunit acyl-CoA synthetase (AMP-forming)
MLLPLHHIYGLCASYLFIARGAALGVCPDFRRLYDAAERFRVNFIAMVPALAEILVQKIERRGKSAEDALGQPIDWVLVGGAALPRLAFD